MHLKVNLCFQRNEKYVSKMAMHFPSSCNALIWHCAIPMLAAYHMAPLTLYPPSDPLRDLLLQELWDAHGDWRTHLAFWFSFPDRLIFFHFPCQILNYCLFFFLLAFTALNFLLFPFPLQSSSYYKQCVNLADWQSRCPSILFCCNRSICINIPPFLALLQDV